MKNYRRKPELVPEVLPLNSLGRKTPQQVEASVEASRVPKCHLFLPILLKIILMASLLFPSLACGEKGKEVIISNVFIEMDLRQVLRDISSQTQIPIIMDPTVQGIVSIDLKEVPLEKALGMILFPSGYTFRKIEDYYVVGVPDPKSPSFNLLSRTEECRLKYLKADDLVRLLSSSLTSYFCINRDRNILTITAPEEIIERIKHDISLLDHPPKQVLIEALVTEVSLDASKKLSMDWQWSGKQGEGVTAESTNLTGKLTYQNTTKFTQKALLTVQALIEQGKAKIRANPKILADDTQNAQITIGTEKYVALTTGSLGNEYTRLEAVKAGVSLKFTPFICEGDNIILQIEPEVSEVIGGGLTGDEPPVVTRRSVKTTITTKDGQTIAIGGLIQQHEEEKVSRIPFISRIPLIGTFFKSTTKSSFETELIIFITPRIIHQTEEISER